MKRLILTICLVLVLVGMAQAEPFLVCNPQTDATGYIYKLNGGPDIEVPYATSVIGGQTVAVIADLAGIPVGPFTFDVRAFKDDPAWGRAESASVPFSASRPSLGQPSSLGIKR